MAALRVGRMLFNNVEPRLLSTTNNLYGKSRIAVHSCRLLHVGSQHNGMKFTKDHEWVKTAGNVGTVGITDHAQQLLGDIVFVELPDVGDEFSQNDVFGVVESVKAASDLYSPVSGAVTEVNEKLQEEPELINTSPYDDGWIAKFELSDASQLDDLMDQSTYDSYVAESTESD